MIRRQIRPAATTLLLFTLLTGLLYPLTVTLLAQILFPWQANGSLIMHDGQVLGSSLIGQPFQGAGYFWPRLSATGGVPYNASASGGSNYSALNPALLDQASQRIAALGGSLPVPVDLVTASGSGLDPHISVAAARYQAVRVAQARGMRLAEVETLIDRHTEQRQLGLLGEQRVNVLELNLAMDGIQYMYER